MPALRSIRPAVGGVARNPVLVAVSALFALAQFPDLFVRPTASPELSAAVSALTFGVLILVVPFFQGGLLAMADEALDGRTGVATLVTAGRDYYLPLLVAYLALLGVSLAFGFLLVVGTVLGIAGSVFGGPAGFVRVPAEDVTLVAVLGIIAVGLFGAYLLVTFFLQFYAHAVVIDGAELVAAFRHSVRLVRSDLGAAFLYTALLAAVGGAFGLLVAAASLTVAPPPAMETAPAWVPTVEVGALETLGLGFGVVAVTGLLGALWATYSVAFYRALAERTPARGRQA
ncbi:hypothetical protein DVK05_04810 [Halorubrum sp. Atlit-8R]|uniref:DUF7847 domain-containing protein n=1 Tax=unclassified Halorubrum TaxID=2642239 RepID=UPI000EF1E29D|nr:MULTISPECIES: hypothetical protein [unclassified Halorubrum]RLM70735.1 hypothetical protein DVK08_00940 [Halorubrum sp. Atlit-9R]RLM83109.1 hypothetical protein DVK05_04810 [Halorubrum sp. Atlit-8R]